RFRPLEPWCAGTRCSANGGSEHSSASRRATTAAAIRSWRCAPTTAGFTSASPPLHDSCAVPPGASFRGVDPLPSSPMPANVETMFAVKQTPWHKLGVVVAEAPTTADAIRLAGLDWRVSLAPLQIAADARAVDACAVVRDSDRSILCHHIGPKFTPLQNE